MSLFDAVARYGEPSPHVLLVAFDSQTRLIELMAAKGILPATELVAMDYGIPGPLPAGSYYGVLGGDFG